MDSTKLTCEIDNLRSMDWNSDTIDDLICIVKKQIIFVNVNLNHQNLVVPQSFTNAIAFLLLEE